MLFPIVQGESLHGKRDDVAHHAWLTTMGATDELTVSIVATRICVHALWKVSKDGQVTWILRGEFPLPKDIQWES